MFIEFMPKESKEEISQTEGFCTLLSTISEVGIRTIMEISLKMKFFKACMETLILTVMVFFPQKKYINSLMALLRTMN